MSCGVSERVQEERTKSGPCRIRKVFSNNAASVKSSRNPGGSASVTDLEAFGNASASSSVVAQAGDFAETAALAENSSLVAAGSAEVAVTSRTGLKCKPRCLCWCYCCSCICVTPVKGKGSKVTEGVSVNELLICDGEPIPTLEEIRAWSKSFDTLMTSVVGRQVFGEFLKLEFSDENILFWLACEDLKLETDPDIIAEKVRLIYEGYVSILSPKEISLDSHVREIVNRNMVEPTTHTFDEAQMQIYMLMMRDSYPRFVNSSLYKSLAQFVEQEGTEQPGSGFNDVDIKETCEPQVQG